MTRLTVRSLAAAVGAVAAIAAASCVKPPAGGAASADSASRVAADSARKPPGDVVPAAAETDTGRIARLEREARALAKTDGCARAEQCLVAPVGHRACGGPRTFLAYCPLTTDSAALLAKLGELARAEDEYQRKNAIGSTCEMRMPPVPSLAGRRCVAGAAGGAP